MQLDKLTAKSYLSLRDAEISFGDLSAFIGANASGKSNILEALAFLHQAVRDRSFRPAVESKGGFLHLAWKGAPAETVTLEAEFSDADHRFRWTVGLSRDGYGFGVRERFSLLTHHGPIPKLEVKDDGSGWWWSEHNGDGATDRRITLNLKPQECGLPVAASSREFIGHQVSAFVEGWAFFDPNPGQLRRAATDEDPLALDRYGRNLASRLRAIKRADPDRFEYVVEATRGVLGVPQEVSIREPPEDVVDPGDRGPVYLLLGEDPLRYPVLHVGASSGTLRMLALMTALFGDVDSTFIGIEEPENHVHPEALAEFARYLELAARHKQIALTTHSSLLVTCLGNPRLMRIVRRTDQGTEVSSEADPEAVQRALAESGFTLGEYYETTGFGAS